MKHWPILLFSFLFLGLGQVRADEGIAKESKATGFTWSVYADSYFSYNFGRPQPASALSGSSPSAAALPSASNSLRVYDYYHSQFTLNVAELSFAVKKDDVSLVADLDFGPVADINAAQSSSSGTVIDEVSKHLGQFVMSYHERDSAWTFDFGKMYTHVGLETAKAKDNWQYSRSSLYSYGIPLWHLGVRVGYEATPNELFFNFYLYNGWNSVYDSNTAKSIGIQAKWMPGDWVFVYNLLAGPEQARNDAHWKVLNEVNATYTIDPKWTVASDLLYGIEEKATVGTSQKNAQWTAWTIAVKRNFSEKTYLSPRYEIYRDHNGYTLGGSANQQTLHSGTVTLGHRWNSVLEGRVEGRMDFSNQKSFRTREGMRHAQTSLLVGLLANF